MHKRFVRAALLPIAIYGFMNAQTWRADVGLATRSPEALVIGMAIALTAYYAAYGAARWISQKWRQRPRTP